MDFATNSLEVECDRRARDGSDLLLIFRLKALKPWMYRDNWKQSSELDGNQSR